MENYEKRYVAFLDMLGFKNIIKNKEFEYVFNIFNNIISVCDAHKAGAMTPARGEEDIQLNNYAEALKNMKINILSDSIILSIPCEKDEALRALINMCYEFQYQLLVDDPVFLRGAITCGDIYQVENILFGKAMIDAYIVEEKISKYPRIVLSKELVEGKEEIIENLMNDTKLILAEDQYYYIDCLYGYLSYSNENSNKIKRYIDDSLKTYTENNIREKYLWLKKEYDRCIS